MHLCCDVRQLKNTTQLTVLSSHVWVGLDFLSSFCGCRSVAVLPGIDWEMQNCRLEKDWETLVSEFVKEQEEDPSKTYPCLVTGGLGKLMKNDDMGVWLCYRGNLIVRYCLSVIVT